MVASSMISGLLYSHQLIEANASQETSRKVVVSQKIYQNQDSSADLEKIKNIFITEPFYVKDKLLSGVIKVDEKQEERILAVMIEDNVEKKSEISSEEEVNTIVEKKRKLVLVTAYSSTVDQTDSTPFITANGTHVHDGTIAANFLKFGTKVKFPSLYGDKIFIVEDRMKSDYKVDIWFPTRQEAINFGAQRVEIEIQ